MRKTQDSGPTTHAHRNRLVARKRVAVAVALTAVLMLAAPVSYVYATIPASIRNPKMEHYHFRMQILVNGRAEDFSTANYQQDYAKDQCNANLPEQPIHFHDDKDQFTHIHWEGMTGGMVMKYYGWNFIGGAERSLGYKLDDLGDVQKVTTHGNFLPAIPAGAQFHVYSGDESGYERRDFKDWENEDLETFFGATSRFPLHKENVKNPARKLWDKARAKLLPEVEAHGTETEAAPVGSDTPETELEKRTRINNMIGNVVIFVQKEAPSDQEIRERFNRLEPLSDSTCGG